jgi:hypothetical protein
VRGTLKKTNSEVVFNELRGSLKSGRPCSHNGDTLNRMVENGLQFRLLEDALELTFSKDYESEGQKGEKDLVKSHIASRDKTSYI